MEEGRLHETIGQNGTEQKNRIVAIMHMMLYNGLKEKIDFEVDAQTNVYNADPGFSNKTPCSTPGNIRICYPA